MDLPAKVLDLESLRCFLAAAHAPSFRAAAQRVHLSPAAFGERIRNLEEELSQPLFVRTTRRVDLTEAGRRLIPAAEQMMQDELQCRQAVTGADILPFSLTLGTRFELGLSWLLPAIEPLRQQRPERTVHLYFGESDDLLQRLMTGRVDAVVSSVRLTRSGLRYAPLHQEDYVFVAHPDLMKARPLIGAEQAADHVLIDTQPDLPLFRYFLDVAPAEPAWTFADHEYMGTISAVRQRVLDQAGVAVLPKYFVQADIDNGRVVLLAPDIQPAQDHFRLIWRVGQRAEPQLIALAEDLAKRPLC